MVQEKMDSLLAGSRPADVLRFLWTPPTTATAESAVRGLHISNSSSSSVMLVVCVFFLCAPHRRRPRWEHSLCLWRRVMIGAAGQQLYCLIRARCVRVCACVGSTKRKQLFLLCLLSTSHTPNHMCGSHTSKAQRRQNIHQDATWTKENAMNLLFVAITPTSDFPGRFDWPRYSLHW